MSESNIDFPTVLSRIIAYAKQMGAKTESSYDRDGGFSYHAETHAFAIGVGAGAAWAATGDVKLLGVVLGAATTLNRGAALSDPKIAQDIAQEPHYGLFGLAVGMALGTVIGMV